MSLQTLDGFGFDLDAMTLRFRTVCNTRGITSRAQFLTAWSAATAAQQAQFLAQLIFGSMRFPEDVNVTPTQIAGLGTP